MANSDAVHSSTISGNLLYPLSPHFSLTTAAGYDKYDYMAAPGVPGPKGKSYSVGFTWRPTERTSLSASMGHRFYGKTYLLNSSLRNRTSVWRLSYDESLTTSLSEFLVVATNNTADLLNQLYRSSIPDDTLRQQAVDHFILVTGLPPTLSHSVNYLTDQFFLQKALRGSVAITGAKNTLLLTVFNISRQPQSVQNAIAPLSGSTMLTKGDTRQSGMDVLWNWKVTALTSAIFRADLSRSAISQTSDKQYLKTFRAALACRLRPKLDGILELKHVRQTSTLPGIGYQENALSAFLAMKF